MWQFVQGSTFQVVGNFQIDAATVDMTGWSVTAEIHDSTGVTLISALTATWLDPTSGLLQLNGGDSSTWPVGKARIDVAVRDTQGNQYVSSPDYFRIIDTPLPV